MNAYKRNYLSNYLKNERHMIFSRFLTIIRFAISASDRLKVMFMLSKGKKKKSI